MKRMIWMLWGLIMAMTACGQTYKYKVNFNVSESDFCDTIPIVVEEGRLILIVEMEGRQRRLLLDTGAGQGVVYRDGSIRGERELGNVVVADGNNRRDTVQVVTMPSFRMGRLVISDYVATLMPRPIGNRRIDGIVGFDLFNKGLSAKIDLQSKTLILTDRRKLFDNESGYEVRYKVYWFVPYVMVSPFIRHTDQVLFDTGSTSLLTMNKESFDRHVYKSQQVAAQVEARTEGSHSIGLLGAEQHDEIVLLHMDRLDWGGFAFTDLRAITTQGASRIGTQLLQYGSVVINPWKKRIKFQPFNGTDTVSVGNRVPNVSFVPIGGRPAVGLIWPTCDAYRLGMRQGDVILSIDDKPMRTFEDFVLFHFVKGQQHRYRLRDREGNIKEIAIER